MADRGGAGIVAQGLRKRFGAVQALAGVDLEVPRGTVLGLLGPNGAGKTTAVKILTTLLPPDEGRATVAGFDVLREADELRAAIGLAGQYAAVDEYLTGRENIDLVGRLYHLPTVELRRRTQDLLERFDLVHAADRPVKTYSGGMRRRLDLGASLVGRPQVLFLDEPTTGLDIRSRLDLWEVIRQLVAEGTTLLLTTQYLEEADVLADRIAVIDRGGRDARRAEDPRGGRGRGSGRSRPLAGARRLRRHRGGGRRGDLPDHDERGRGQGRGHRPRERVGRRRRGPPPGRGADRGGGPERAQADARRRVPCPHGEGRRAGCR